MEQVDQFGSQRLGPRRRAAGVMKGKAEFWLPLPPAVLAVANGSVEEWTRKVRISHGEISSKWVFASDC
ncbi:MULTISPECIES: hypothetical protein [Bradyrhizobium]|uniref:hypothetical protein n=1 Tax=Bradyrhizobium TaxID=374 RepID=UPI001EDA812E|nr:hypothetical protein [Bradyrhizobium zhengyangense]MCG2645721.1 hypothetical protein [Bradyrhizobium zhengyangense]